MSITIRPATPADAPALSHICLVTADAGASAAPLHNIPALPGLVYALPYVHLPHTYGFVMQEEHTRRVVGYVLGATDTRAFEDAAEAHWWPALRAEYPLPPGDPAIAATARSDADAHYIRLLHTPARASAPCVAFAPAHLHIDILPEYQRQGWGRRLIDTAVAHLRDVVGLERVWLAMDPRNASAALFYARLGFEHVPGASEASVGLLFDRWGEV